MRVRRSPFVGPKLSQCVRCRLPDSHRNWQGRAHRGRLEPASSAEAGQVACRRWRAKHGDHLAPPGDLDAFPATGAPNPFADVLTELPDADP